MSIHESNMIQPNSNILNGVFFIVWVYIWFINYFYFFSFKWVFNKIFIFIKLMGLSYYCFYLILLNIVGLLLILLDVISLIFSFLNYNKISICYQKNFQYWNIMNNIFGCLIWAQYFEIDQEKNKNYNLTYFSWLAQISII